MDISTIDAKLDQIIAMLGGSAPPLDACDMQPIGPDQAAIDGRTVNVDGSIWGRTLGDEGEIIRIVFGYVTERKCPEVWGAARSMMTPEDFAAWDGQMKARRWSIYRADPRGMIASGTINFVSLGYLLQPWREVRPAGQ